MVKTGGPAFPQTDFYAATMEREGIQATHPGMTLRDWFAGQALAGLYASHDGSTQENTAAEAYTIADAMIAERSKP